MNQKICECGEKFLGHGNTIRCPTCQDRKYLENKRRQNAKAKLKKQFDTHTQSAHNGTVNL